MVNELLIIVLLCLMVWGYWRNHGADDAYPPGPPTIPVLGNLWTLRFQLHHDTFIQLSRVYGDVYTVWLGHIPVIVLNGYRAVKEVLSSHNEDYIGRPVFPLFMDLMGEKGIVLTSGHTWKQQRRFGQVVFRNLGLGKGNMEMGIQEEAQSLLTLFATQEGAPMDPSPWIMHSVSNVISALVFGKRFPLENKAFQELHKATELVVAAPGTFWARIYDLVPNIMRHLPGPHQRAFHYFHTMCSFIQSEVQGHHEMLRNGSRGPGQERNVIDYYLTQISKTQGDPNSTYNEENLVHLVADLFMTGTETVTTTLRWAILYMMVFPEIQGKVQLELDTVLEPSHVIAYEDRKRLPYTNAVIHEIQRFGNIVSVGVVRKCMKETKLGRFKVPQGTIILPNLSSVLYDPEQWKTPREFNPQHFLDENGTFVTKEAFLPFSAGHRGCLGEQLARTELFIFFSNLLQRFSFHVPEGDSDVRLDCVQSATLQPYPYRVCAVLR
ncbi:cytochrome P450 2J2-like [Spea bombifrons]|uniref:cytochrome P450 2J2-like n=1 Tax=Spea bombifrons TaxID=233779 RepID=UPI00234AA967|nr:cytochrome P450 2J2-like [Spea bombifrons]